MSRRRKGGGRPGGGGSPVVSGQVFDRSDPRQTDTLRIIRGGEQIQIGDLDEDSERELVTATFRLRDPRTGEVVTLRVNPDLTELTVVDLLEEADKIAENDPRAMTMTKKYALEHVHPGDRDRFWEIVRAKRLDSAGTMVLCWKILSAITANPTGGQSGYSDGLPGTSQSSPPGSSTPAAGPSGAPSEPDRLRAAFLGHIDRIQAQTDDMGNVRPINAAVAAQLVVAAKARGIDLTSTPSVAATG